MNESQSLAGVWFLHSALVPRFRHKELLNNVIVLFSTVKAWLAVTAVTVRDLAVTSHDSS